MAVRCRPAAIAGATVAGLPREGQGNTRSAGQGAPRPCPRHADYDYRPVPQRSAAAEDRYRSAACDWSVEMVEERSRGLGAEHAVGASSPGPGHITRGTVEERIDAMIADRRQLADSLLDGDREMNLTELSDDELLQLVRPDVTRGATPFCGTRGDTRQSGRYAAPTAAQAPSGHPSAGGQRSRLGVVAAPGTWHSGCVTGTPRCRWR